MKKLIITASLALVSAVAVADDRIENKMLQDPAFEQNRAKAIKLVESRGYQVIDIDADDHLGKPVFDVEAVKNNQEYDIRLSYPSLKIQKEAVDR